MQATLDTLGDLDCVCVTFLVDGKFYRFLALDPCDCFPVFVALFDGRNITQVNWLSGDVSDNCVAKLIDALKFIQCSNEEALAAFFQSASRKIHILCANAL